MNGVKGMLLVQGELAEIALPCAQPRFSRVDNVHNEIVSAVARERTSNGCLAGNLQIWA